MNANGVVDGDGEDGLPVDRHTSVMTAAKCILTRYASDDLRRLEVAPLACTYAANRQELYYSRRFDLLSADSAARPNGFVVSTGSGSRGFLDPGTSASAKCAAPSLVETTVAAT